MIVVDNGGDGTGVGVLTSTEVSGKTFRVALRGYAEEEVDAFLDRIVKTLREYEAGRRGDLTAEDIEQQTFRVALRGYAEEEVDQFLDEVAAVLRQHRESVPVRSSLVPAKEVEEKTFRVALRAYAEKKVDVFLDRVVETLREWEAGRPGDLKAQDVEPHAFPVEWRGYAEEEVDSFLDEVAETLRVYERRKIERLAQPVPNPAATTEKSEPPAAKTVSVALIPPQPTQPVVTEPPVREPPPIVEPAPTVTRLIVTRTAESGGRPYTVLLDDQPIGKISAGTTERFEIPAGMHWVTAKTRKEQSNVQVIEPDQGDQITLRCGPASGQIDDLGRKMEGIILETDG